MMDPLQAIAEPRRRAILALIWEEERPAGEIADQFDITFGAVSQHLGVLRETGLVTMRKDGNRRFYRADRDALAPFKSVLKSMWQGTLTNLADEIEKRQSGPA